MNALRSRTPLASAVMAVVGAVELGGMALYAALHPQPLPGDQVGAWRVMSENQGAVAWPAFLAILSLVAAVAVLRSPSRFSYLFTGALGAIMVGVAFTLPAWLSALAPFAVLIGLTGVAAVIVAVLGWLTSDPLPGSLPGWPEHHGGI